MTAPQTPSDPDEWSLDGLVRVSSAPIPPAEPYKPTERGELVTDARTKRVGVFMDFFAGAVHLRPLRGGPEWRVPPEWITKGPTELEARLRERNRDSNLTDSRLPHRDVS
ncbi:hypothetical protein OU787_17445 [Kitasatospora sp. YST-16]|uniref:hypothetical protein n=1 Tax=Kitasatospora sp. YST-16 TaxID=2998080 RepID=UPI002284A8D4|nr:hypothetical protein [Kitasatospora sp. YST-16]WAL73135.1 hypothetical protein OU787_17445 [Kitasatospora sp. YST-16]WNW39189.1 hypothetical protein RKE32_17410 [Streptomyces sp. Li-HN-5-13]